MTVASLGMYDHPAQRAANDALWAGVAGALRADGIDAPAGLDRTRPVEAIWRDPNLLLAQACGYPLVNDADLDLRVVAVPSYRVAGCADGRHFSHVILRADDPANSVAAFADRRAAINAAGSNTGCNLLYAAVAGAGAATFATVIETGSHRASAEAVRDGDADVAAIDAVTWAALVRFEPETIAGLRILAPTPSSPALPFVTAAATDDATLARLRAALSQAMSDPDLATARDALFLAAISPATADPYAVLRRSIAMEPNRC